MTKLNHYWSNKTFWGIWHKARIEEQMKKNEDEYIIIKRLKHHAIRCPIYIGDPKQIIDVTWEIHKVGECGTCLDAKTVDVK